MVSFFGSGTEGPFEAGEGSAGGVPKVSFLCLFAFGLHFGLCLLLHFVKLYCWRKLLDRRGGTESSEPIGTNGL